MDNAKLQAIVEALFAASDKPISVNQIFDVFIGDIEQPGKDEIRQAIAELGEKYNQGGIELKQVASGFRLQVRADFETWVARLWEQKPPRYSRALLETLALIAYRQPITRGEIEDIRGVSVSTNIIRTLEERDWVKSLGHKEVPGRPILYGTTREFLDYFNLKSLNELPTLAEIRDLDQFNPEFSFEEATVSGDSPPAENGEEIDAADDSSETEDVSKTEEVGDTVGASETSETEATDSAQSAEENTDSTETRSA